MGLGEISTWKWGGDKDLIPREQADGHWLLASLGYVPQRGGEVLYLSACLQRRCWSVAFVIGEWSCLYFMCLPALVYMCAHFGNIPSATYTLPLASFGSGKAAAWHIADQEECCEFNNPQYRLFLA